MPASFEERTEAELRRGVLQLVIVALLAESRYGYDLLRVLEELGLPTEEGTLYPILRRLAKEGVLEATWDTTGSRPRKYYQTTDKGQAVLRGLVTEWRRVDAALVEALTRVDSTDATDRN